MRVGFLTGVGNNTWMPLVSGPSDVSVFHAIGSINYFNQSQT